MSRCKTYTDGEILYILLSTASKDDITKSCRINVYGGIGYDRVVRKAKEKGYIKISRFYYKANRTWLEAIITGKGLKKLKTLKKL